MRHRPPRHRQSQPRRAVAIAVVAASILAACGSDGDDSSADDTVASAAVSSVPLATADATGDFPRSVDHVFGETVIEEQPERVATVGFTDHDTVLALGVTPVLVREWFGEQPHAAWPWAIDLVEGEPVVMSGDLNYELIASTQPDVIIAAYAGLTEEEFELLNEIAPTVAQSGEHDAYLTPWQTMATTIGEVLGRDDEVAALIAGVEDEFAAVQAAHPELVGGAGVAVNTRDDGTFGVRGPTDARGRFLSSVGLQMPAEIEALIPPGEFVAPISFERIDLLSSGLDVVVWAPESDADQQWVEELALYPDEGRVVFIGEQEAAALGFSSVLSLPWAIDHVVPRLQAAVDGDPATDVGAAR